MGGSVYLSLAPFFSSAKSIRELNYNDLLLSLFIVEVTFRNSYGFESDKVAGFLLYLLMLFLLAQTEGAHVTEQHKQPPRTNADAEEGFKLLICTGIKANIHIAF
jgi:hypothetical protein